MKHIYLIIFSVFLFSALKAQQDPQYTQFMEFKMIYNPAFAGLDGSASFTGIVRQQWLGFEGGPQSQLLNFHMPLGGGQRVGVGGTIRRFTIGPLEEYLTEAAYAYRVPFARGTLSMGIQGSVKLLRVSFDQLSSIQPKETDNAIPMDIQSKTLPNFGFGFYYDAENLYLGFSAPRLLSNNIDFTEDISIISKEVTHIYLMGGFTFGDPETLQWQPQILLKYVSGAPFDADLSISGIYGGRYALGVGYRVGGSKRSGIGESVSLFLSIAATEKFKFGVGYDVTLSDFKRYNSGTLEGFVKYVIGGSSKGNDFSNPRGTDQFFN